MAPLRETRERKCGERRRTKKFKLQEGGLAGLALAIALKRVLLVKLGIKRGIERV